MVTLSFDPEKIRTTGKVVHMENLKLQELIVKIYSWPMRIKLGLLSFKNYDLSVGAQALVKSRVWRDLLFDQLNTTSCHKSNSADVVERHTLRT